MSDKELKQSNDPVEREEFFEDKLYSEVTSHTGFDSIAKAADLSLCNREELALGNLSDKELERELVKLQDYLELPPSIYYGELLKATQQRLRFLSASLKRYEGKEVFEHQDGVQAGQQRLSDGFAVMESGVQASLPERYRHRNGLEDVATPMSEHVHRAIGLTGETGPQGNNGSDGVAISEDQPYLIKVMGTIAYPHPEHGLMVSDNYLTTRDELRGGIGDVVSTYAAIRTYVERVCGTLEVWGKDNIGYAVDRLVNKHDATAEQIFVLSRVADLIKSSHNLDVAKQVLHDLKDLVTFIDPPPAESALSALADEVLKRGDGSLNEMAFKTVVVPYEDPEPKLQGNLSMGLSREWIDWYRRQGNGHSLIETRDEGLRRLAELRTSQAKEAPAEEPPMRTESGVKNMAWFSWYRSIKNCTLREAMYEFQRREEEAKQ